MTTTFTPAGGLLARIRDALFSPRSPGTAEQAADTLQDVTRWAWLPALSGVAVAADQARSAYETAGGGTADQT
jgi:hypothetical protein